MAIKKDTTSAEIMKVLGISKGTGNPRTTMVGNMTIDQLVKVTKARADRLIGKDLKSKTKEILGVARSMGVTCEGMSSADMVKAINEGKFDDKLQ